MVCRLNKTSERGESRSNLRALSVQNIKLSENAQLVHEHLTVAHMICALYYSFQKASLNNESSTGT